MPQTNQILTSEQRIGNKLKQLSNTITPQEKTLFRLLFRKSKAVVNQYLNGDVSDISIGLGMLAFFMNAINNR